MRPSGCTSRRARCRIRLRGWRIRPGWSCFVRRSRPMRLSSAGMKLLRLAEDVLPRLAALEEEFEGLRSGKSGRLHIAIECHACFDWLLPVLEAFRTSWPEVDVDIRPGLQFEALAGAVAGRGRPRGVVGSRRAARCRFHAAFRLRAGLRLCRRSPAGGQTVDRGGGFRRAAPDHLPGGNARGWTCSASFCSRRGWSRVRSGRWNCRR